MPIPWQDEYGYWLAPGDYYILVVTDGDRRIYEQSDDNNASAELPITLIRRTADLVVSSVSAEATAWSGSELTVNWSVENIGNGEPCFGGWLDGVYLSEDPDIGFDVWLGYVPSLRALGPGESYDRQFSLPLPIDLEGTYYVTVMADVPLPPDYKNRILEDPSETNNITVADDPTDVFLSPVPDLIVEAVDAPTETISGQFVTLSWTVRNQGAHADANWMDAVFLSYDQIYDPREDFYLGYEVIRGPLDAGATYTASADFEIPPGMSGPFYVFVYTDHYFTLNSNKVYERDREDNNVGLDPEAMLITLAPPAELVIGTMTVPESAVTGTNIAVSYTVENHGPNHALGHWYDSLYASLDETWDVNDLLIGRVHHVGDVLAGESYTETFEEPLPGLLPGDYNVIIRTDIRNHIRETDEENNIAASLDAVAIDFEELAVGVPASGSLGQDQSVYYRVDVPAGQTLEILLDSEAQDAGNEVYVRYGMMATRGLYDVCYSDPYHPDQRVIVPTTTAGTCYILVHGGYVPGTVSTLYSIAASLLTFGLESASPGSAGNVGDVTFEMNGALLAEDMTYELLGPNSEVVPSAMVYFEDAATVYVTFNLRGVPTGPYDGRVTANDGATAILEDAVLVVPGQGPKLDADLVMPDAILPGPFVITVEYENTGDTDMIVPMMHVVGPEEAYYGLVYGADHAQGEIRFLGYSPTGPAGVLRPAQREHVKLYCSPLTIGTHWFTLTSLSVDPNNPTPRLVDWTGLGEDFRAPFADNELWMALWTIFSTQAGATWQEVIAQLAHRLTEEPYVNGIPNILVGNLMQDALADAMSRGGGLTDQEPPWLLAGAAVDDPLGVHQIDLIFSETIDPATLGPDDILLIRPDGNPIDSLTITEVIDRLYRIEFPAQFALGTYLLGVGPEIADTVGYLMDQDTDGVHGEPVKDVFTTSFRLTEWGRLAGQLYVTSHAPSGDRDQREGVDHVTIEVSQPIYFQTFTPEDVNIQGPAGSIPVTAVTRLTQTSYRVDFPHQEAVGTYTLTVGPHVMGLTGEEMDQDADATAGEVGEDAYVGTFLISDVRGPRVVAYIPNDWMSEPVDAVEVTFSEPIDADTFTLDDVTITGPSGEVIATGIVPVSDTVFRIEFPSQKEGTDYVVTIGPAISDGYVNPMDQDDDGTGGMPDDAFTGTFHIDPGLRLLPDVSGSSQMFSLSSNDRSNNEVTVFGRVVYDGVLPDGFPWGAEVTVQLWEQDGKRDGSLRTRVRRYQGVEIVSPVLRGGDGLEQVRKVADLLNRMDAHVNATCGLHVHVGVTSAAGNDFDDVADWVRRLLNTTAQHEMAFCAWPRWSASTSVTSIWPSES